MDHANISEELVESAIRRGKKYIDPKYDNRLTYFYRSGNKLLRVPVETTEEGGTMVMNAMWEGNMKVPKRFVPIK